MCSGLPQGQNGLISSFFGQLTVWATLEYPFHKLPMHLRVDIFGLLVPLVWSYVQRASSAVSQLSALGFSCENKPVLGHYPTVPAGIMILAHSLHILGSQTNRARSLLPCDPEHLKAGASVHQPKLPPEQAPCLFSALSPRSPAQRLCCGWLLSTAFFHPELLALSPGTRLNLPLKFRKPGGVE